MDTGEVRLRGQVLAAIAVAIVFTASVAYTSYVLPNPGDDLKVSIKVLANAPGDGNESLPNILGASVDWTDNAGGLYDPVSGLLNPVPVAEVIGLKPSHLRFPATGLSQIYNWMNGTGINRNQNPSYGKYPQISNFGTDEFLKLVDHTGSEAVMVVNAHSDKATLAANWVSYCNDLYWVGKGRDRNANGYREPYDIKYWEIGYEMYLNKWAKNGKKYAEVLVNFSKAMKAVDPDIKVGAWLALHSDVEQSSIDLSWNLNVLDGAKGKFKPREDSSKEVLYYDYVVVSVDLPRIDLLLDPEDLYSYSYARTYESIRDDMTQLQGLLSTWGRDRAEDIPIAIASFEPDFGSSGWNTEAPAQAASSVITANVALEVLRRSLDGNSQRILYSCYGELNTPQFSSLLTNPAFEDARMESWYRSPNYFVIDMCTELQGLRMLSTAPYRVPTFSVDEEKGLRGVKNVPYGDSLASISDDNRTIEMVLINRDFNREATFELIIDGWYGTIEVQERWISSVSPLSNNLLWEGVVISSDLRNVSATGFEVKVPNASVMHLTLHQSGGI